MALVAELIGEALLDAIDQSRAAVAAKAKAALGWLREKAEPPDGVELRSQDGSMFSGIALFERNRVVLMLAVRHPNITVERQATVDPPPRQQPFAVQTSLVDPDSSVWDRDGDPFRR